MTGTIKEIKRFNSSNEYDSTPIGCDAENVDMADGSTLEETITDLKNKFIVDSDLSLESENAVQNKAVMGYVSQLSNPNLLINPDFKINQRGVSGNLANVPIFIADRWRSHQYVNTVFLDKGIRLTSTQDNNLIHIGQWIEDYKILLGQTLTASIKYKHSNNTPTKFGFRIMTVESVAYRYVIDLPTCDEMNTIHITTKIPSIAPNNSEIGYFDIAVECGDSCNNEEWVNATWGTYNEVSSIDIEWVKLELGTIATLFTPPDPSTELVKCQRYYEIVNTSRVAGFLFSGNGDTRIRLPMKVTKRVAPTPTILGDNALSVSGVNEKGAFDNLTLVIDHFQLAKNSVSISSISNYAAWQTYGSNNMFGVDTARDIALDAEIY